MKVCKALAGYEVTSTDWRGRTRARRITSRQAARRGLPLCAFCHQAWVPHTDAIVCSPGCHLAYRRQQAQRATRQTLTFPKEPLL